jgi:LPXTG-site transpeptidase (sortase) family protein
MKRTRNRLLSMLGIAAIAAGVALLVSVVGAISHDDGGPRLDAAAIGAPVNDAPKTEAPTTPAPRRARPKRVATPVRVEIPAIGVRAPIIKLGLNPDRTLEVPTDFGDAGWWSGGSRPGENGPAVIVGHVDSKSGPAVFYRLHELRRGEKVVVVRRDGSRVRFTVQGTERFPKDEFPTMRVYGRTDGPTLRLITCGGAFDSSTGHYVDNWIVYGR